MVSPEDLQRRKNSISFELKSLKREKVAAEKRAEDEKNQLVETVAQMVVELNAFKVLGKVCVV